MHWLALVAVGVKPGGHMAGWPSAVHMPVALGALLSKQAFWPTAGEMEGEVREGAASIMRWVTAGWLELGAVSEN